MKSSRVLRTTLAALCATASFAAAAESSLPRTRVQAAPHVFDVEVAATPAQRAQGLMGRTLLADDAGMLFVFEEADRHCFWMKDTAIPLSIAFLADDGSIVNIADMQPRTTDLHCAEAPVRHALEVKRGGFSGKGIQRGSRFSGRLFVSGPE